MSCWLAGDLFRTKLFSRIHHNRRRHVQTRRLSPELLHLLLLQLPPPAEQVQTQEFLCLVVKAHHQAVCTGCVEEGHGEVELSPGEAAALECDVGVQILTAVTKTEDACEGNTGGFIGKVNAGAVSAFEVLQVRRIVQTGCN